MSVFRVDIPYLEKAIGAGESHEHAISYVVEGATWIDALTKGVQRFEEVAHQDFHGWICQLKHDHVQVVDFETGQTFRFSSQSTPVPSAPARPPAAAPRELEAARRADLQAALISAADGEKCGAAERVLNVLASGLDVDASAVLVIDEPQGDLRFAAATGPKASEVLKLRVPVTQGVAGFCTRTGQALAVENAELTPLFDPTVSQGVGYPTSAMAAAPIKRGDRTLGAVEVLNPRGRSAFTQEELSLVITAGLLLGLALGD